MITKPLSINYKLLILIIAILFIDIFSAKKLRSLNEVIESTDKYLYTKKTEVKAEMIDTTTPFYVAYAYMTLPMKFEDAVPYFLDIENYEHLFKYITDMRSVKDRFHPKDSVYYIEGKTHFIHGWGLGKLNHITLYPDSLIDLEVRPASRWLVNKYKKERKGKIRWYIKRVYLDGKLLKVDDKHCRIGIRGVASTNKPMPTWLVSLIMKFIFPGLMKDAVDIINSGEKYPPDIVEK